jgi:hypothetical protein
MNLSRGFNERLLADLGTLSITEGDGTWAHHLGMNKTLAN